MNDKTVTGTYQGLSRSGWEEVKRDVLRGRWTDTRAGNSVYGFLQEYNLLA